MGDDYDNFWDPYCPCKVTRKNIVMTFLAMASFALVAWTVIITGQANNLLDMEGSNVTYITVDDSKEVFNINITMATQRVFSAVKAANEKKVAAINAAADKATESRKSKLKYITSSPQEGSEVLCQCLCGLNVTIDEVISALEFMQANRDVVKVVTTTAPPVIEEENDWDDPYAWN